MAAQTEAQMTADGAKPRAWLLLLAAIALEVAASLSLKGALERPLLYGVVAIGYIGAFACLGLVLRAGMPLGAAYGIWGASGVALTAVLSMVVFGEPFGLLMGAGIVLIIAGVVCVELGSQHAPRAPSAGEEPSSWEAAG
ncbi:DMT family transporter [Brevibacterium album]|uniref:DMT family transporter n=1 Tax=Brevibacterium album TaxID=417948 RepID=UPI0003F8BEDD|nr:SMR family transporter [Brevibacterium album]